MIPSTKLKTKFPGIAKSFNIVQGDEGRVRNKAISKKCPIQTELRAAGELFPRLENHYGERIGY